MEKVNLHTHLAICKHATGTISQYLKRAHQLGYHTLGISDHVPWPKSLTSIISSRRMTLDDFPKYLSDLDKFRKIAAERYQISLLSGLEIEFLDQLSTQLPTYAEKFDYLILGQHYVKLSSGKIVDIYGHGSDEVLLSYQETILKALNTGYFKILAHPEIFSFCRTWDETCDSVSLALIESCYKNHVYLEVNANGIRKKFHGFNYKEEELPYPRIQFWTLVKAYQEQHPDLLIIVNDDSHAPEDMGDQSTLKAWEFIEKLDLIVTPFKIN